ncbi:MAG: sporulation peptidase YabG [Clostridiales bacterium]|jgi:spore coat assembly protein|nr:sporulation peptidase YabG [Clostridiales bacterium]
MEVGDIVGRKSYGCDVFFRVTNILNEQRIVLTGVNYRLLVCAETNDLRPIRLDVLRDFRMRFIDDAESRVRKIIQSRPNRDDCKAGKVLHIDSDPEYLKICLHYYDQLAVPAIGENIVEYQQANQIVQYLERDFPDILVITGHDSLYNKKAPGNMENYRSSGFFREAIRAARCFNPSKDSLVIIAGACQSNYEALIEAGANIASSPGRILIHALDPVFAAEKIAFTSIETVLDMEDILENSVTGRQGLGGYQTRGVMREGFKARMA